MTLPNENRFQFLIKFSYVGWPFYGVHEQPKLTTVLSALRLRIEKYGNQKALALTVSARTDKGVHALENYATFHFKTGLDVNRFIKNMTKPHDDSLYAVEAWPVPRTIHARGSALNKVYRYTIIDGCEETDDKHPYAWTICPRLSVTQMVNASYFFLGEKDFSSFKGGGCESGSPIKQIYSITILRSFNNYIFIEIHGKSFLRKMIRNIVGLLVEVGSLIRHSDEIQKIFDKKRRSAAGITAPAHALMLKSVGLEIELLQSRS